MLRFKPRSDDTHPVPQELSDYPIAPQLLRLLCQRGINTREKLDQYLKPSRDDLYDPLLLQDMDKAVSIIRGALRDKKRITVFGDYDVDGVTATAILLSYLRKCGAEVDYYIPDRHGEGYGLNTEAVKQISLHSELLITVDCGITCVTEVEYAKQLGMQVIVTDHHQLAPEIPAADAVIDPLLGAYPFRKLCGAGVAFKIVQALGGDEAIAPYWDLAALATIADIVPLLDENRVIVTFGLDDMSSSMRPGIQALMESAGMLPDSKAAEPSTGAKPITASDIAFRIAPRINAGGRLAKASRSVELLITQDIDTARLIASELNEDNEQRRRLEQEVYLEADRKTIEEINFLEERAIIVCGQEWNTGVIGLAAARLVEKYRWPAILLSEQNGFFVGSARSIPGVDIHRALSACGPIFERFGGHAQAAGLTIRKENLPALKERLTKAIREQSDPDAFLPTEEYDLEIPLSDVSEDLIQAFSLMQPTGFGNQQAVFFLNGVRVSDLRRIGKDSAHLRLRLIGDGAVCPAIGFRMGEEAEHFPTQIDATVGLIVNEWQGNRTVQCELRRVAPFSPVKSFYLRHESRKDEIDLTALRIIAYRDQPPDGNSKLEEPRTINIFQLGEELKTTAPGELQGMLFCIHSTDAIKALIPHLAVFKLQDRLNYDVHTLSDARGFNTLLLAPRWRLVPQKLNHVFMLDGFVAEAEKRYVLNQYGSERVTCVTGLEKSRQKQAERILPDERQLADVWRLLKKREGGHADRFSLTQELHMSQSQFMCALLIFQELRLLTIKEKQPFQYSLDRTLHVSLQQSAIRNDLLQMIHRKAEA